MALTNIVIVTWNSIIHTKLTIESLFEATSSDYYLTIVDNGSSDGTSEYLQNLKVPKNCLGYEVVLNKNNTGYGHAINQGYVVSKKLNLKYTCVCNNDLYFENDWLTNLEVAMENDVNCGIMGTLRPGIFYKHHTSNLSTKEVVDQSPFFEDPFEELKFFCGSSDINEGFTKIKAQNNFGIYKLMCPPDAVVTCCAIVRNSAIEKAGGLADEVFETYGSEDIDLSWRLFDNGFTCKIHSGVYVHHFRHRSINDSNLDRKYYLKLNNIKFIKKWETKIQQIFKEEMEKGQNIEDIFDEKKNPSFYLLKLINNNIDFINSLNIGSHE